MMNIQKFLLLALPALALSACGGDEDNFDGASDTINSACSHLFNDSDKTRPMADVVCLNGTYLGTTPNGESCRLDMDVSGTSTLTAGQYSMSVPRAYEARIRAGKSYSSHSLNIEAYHSASGGLFGTAGTTKFMLYSGKLAKENTSTVTMATASRAVQCRIQSVSWQ